MRSTCDFLAQRWGLSRSTVGRLLKKLADLEYLTLMSFPGRTGSVIYNQFCSNGDGHKEEAAFLLEGAVVVQHRVMLAPALDTVLDHDRSIRTNGGSGLFYYTVLCSYANFRTSYRRLDGITSTKSSTTSISDALP